MRGEAPVKLPLSQDPSLSGGAGVAHLGGRRDTGLETNPQTWGALQQVYSNTLFQSPNTCVC